MSTNCTAGSVERAESLMSAGHGVVLDEPATLGAVRWANAAWETLRDLAAAVRESEKTHPESLDASVMRTIAAVVERADRAELELHALRWTLGLGTHHGEKPQSMKKSVANLRNLIKAARGEAR